ncbi:MAG: hypothetical protein A2428_10015 [Bdellovibrionales bacterium RIFOXYC1_FULL_54_43]|nr:MAG: hypothetical protein A2428_10015 [Bdellovibrionales bacterium RIFOXYC1_FULL_54_43]OFZ80519.1 MAG: hypothetical protein A2603_13110 [Bdellovibrionales bacterium RIFOXYD1_FULL_55_31]
MERYLHEFSAWIAFGITGLSTFVILGGVATLVVTSLRELVASRKIVSSHVLRLRLGRALSIALELLLAADILRTAMAPTWDEIGKLAAIVVLRTSLNFFLEREIQNEASRTTPKPS